MSDLTRRRSPALTLAVVGFSVFVAADDLTVVSTMLRPIVGDLGLILPDGLNELTWLVNAYLIAFVAVMPLAGRLSDVIGRRMTFTLAYALFLVGTVVVPVSVSLDHSFGWFVVGRVLTALGGGAMVPVALAVVGDVYPPGQRSRALGTLGAIETLGWVWGPLYGAMLVRFLSWQWQFWLNVPLALVGLAASWWVLADTDDRFGSEPEPRIAARRGIDWLGASLLTTALVALNIALLSGARIQSVTGLDELTDQPSSMAWLYAVAVVCGIGFVAWERRSRSPLIDPTLFRGRNVNVALVVNFVVGAGLVVAMVDVPLFVNAVEPNIGRAAVLSGWVLSALTAAMAVGSVAGGRITDRTWYRPPLLIGVSLATAAYAWMGATWSADRSFAMFALQLGLLGTGFGLTVAPTTGAVVDAAPSDGRGAAAGVVMLVRLLGFSVGLSALTAWALRRFDALRSTIELPPIGSDGFEAALAAAQQRLTAGAIADTFTAAGAVVALGVVAGLFMRRSASTPTTATTATHDRRPIGDEMDPDHDPNHDPGYEPATPLPPSDEVAALRRRVNLLVAAMGVLLIGTIGLVLLLIGRVNSAQADATAARERAATAEAGAALYASQIQGFQEQITTLQPQIADGLDSAIAGLDEFGSSTIEFPVSIDQTVPIDTEVRINRTVEVPIKLTVPIEETFETTIQIDTFAGKIPLDVTVPVDVDVPIDETISIPIDETIPIQEQVPIKIDLPVEIDIGDTQLATLTESLTAGLRSFQEMLDGLAAPPPPG